MLPGCEAPTGARKKERTRISAPTHGPVSALFVMGYHVRMVYLSAHGYMGTLCTRLHGYLVFFNWFSLLPALVHWFSFFYLVLEHG